MIENTWGSAEKLVTNILSLTKQLQQQLVQEAKILKTAPQPVELDGCTTNKKQLTSRLEQFNQQFSEILAADGLPNNQNGINEYFQRAALAGLPAADAVANWQEIQLVCVECKFLNESNGASIDLLSQHAKRSLDILKGKNRGATIYGRDGAHKSDPLTHTLTFYL
jgi:flagellar biosynthesis protein FlgN